MNIVKEEDKIIIWSKRLLELNPQPDTITLLINEFNNILGEGNGVWIDLKIKGDIDGENAKLINLMCDLVELDFQEETMRQLKIRLYQYRNYKINKEVIFQGLYGREFNRLIQTNFEI